MKILHVVPTYLPAVRYGGPIVSVHGLCRGLAARGHEVTVFTTNVDGPGISDVPLGRAVSLDGVNVFYFPARFQRLYWSPEMRRALGQRVRQMDIVHTHSVFLWPTAAAAREAHRQHVPYVVSPRGMLVDALIRRKSRLVKRAWLSLVERRNLERATAVHFTSRREWEDAIEVGLPIPEPVVVPNGIDLPDPNPTDREPNRIVYLGRLNWKKGIDRLIDALPMLPAANLEIAGNDEEDYEPVLRRRAAELGVADRVLFSGAVNDEGKWRLLRRATVFVLPSLSENFGNSVLEAMAASTPVVVTPEVGLADDVSSSRAGVVAAGNPRDLAQAITRILEDVPERAAMGGRGRELVESRFTWPKVAETMELHYRRWINN